MSVYGRARRFWITLYDASVGTSIQFPPNVKYGIWRLIRNGDKLKISGFVMLHEPSALSALQRYLPEFLLEASAVSAKVMREQVMSLESPYPPLEYGNYRLRGVCRKLFDSSTCPVTCATLSGSTTESPSEVCMSDPRISQGVVKDSNGSDPIGPSVDTGKYIDRVLGTELVKEDVKGSVNSSDMLIGVKACDLPKVLDNPDYTSRRDYRYSNKRKSGYRSSLGSKYACDRSDKFYDPRDRMYTPFRSHCKS